MIGRTEVTFVVRRTVAADDAVSLDDDVDEILAKRCGGGD